MPPIFPGGRPVAAAGARGTFMSLCRRRGGSQTRPSHLHPLVSVGEGLAPPAGFVPYRLIQRGFRRPGGEPLLERSKRGEKIAGVCSDGQVTSILIWMWPVHSHYTPGPPFTGELGTGVWWKYTGAGWPLTHNRPPARCHCAVKPEGRPCYPFKTRLPWSLPRGAVGIGAAQPCRGRHP